MNVYKVVVTPEPIWCTVLAKTPEEACVRAKFNILEANDANDLLKYAEYEVEPAVREEV